jgi:predicted CoA-binding protein
MLDETTMEYLIRRQRKKVIEQCRRIAIVGAGTDPNCASHVRTQKLLAYGLEIAPVIPNCEHYLGFPCYARLRDVPGDIDIVQVYPVKGIDLLAMAQKSVEKKARAFWVEEGEVDQKVKDVLASGKVQVVEHESLEKEYSKHFPFIGPERAPQAQKRSRRVEECMTTRGSW